MTFDAVQFLESLFRPVPVLVTAEVPLVDVTLPEITPGDLPSEWRMEFEERAAIREFDGKMPRELAEHYALLDVLQMMKADCTE